MADKKISALTAASTPLAGTEVFPIVQSSATVKATIANVQAAPVSAGTANGVVYLNGSKVPTTGSVLTFDGASLGVGVTPTARLGVPVPEYSTSSTSGMIRFQNPNVSADSCIQSYYVSSSGSELWIGVNSYIDTLGSVSRFNTGYASSYVNIRRDGNIAFGTNTSSGAAVERARVTPAGNVVAGGSAALATNATDGFLYVPTCAGTPTGTPTAINGMAPIVVDTTNNKLYFYSGGAWRDAGP